MENTDIHVSPRDILKKYFGYSAFRAHQEEAINHLVAGRDAFVLMPTGSGKSLCYQVPALIRPGVCVVISPLIALMQDQVDAVRELGIRAGFLNSTLDVREARSIEQRAMNGGFDLLYVAPERLLTESFMELLGRIRICLFAIDEAHCVSHWGHDFRPEYLKLDVLARIFPGVPRVALTATADEITRREIIDKLRLKDAGQFITSFDRPNIRYRVEIKENEKDQLMEFIRSEHPGEAGIVYCMTRKKAEVIAKFLAGKGLHALPYHAGLERETRLNNQREFLRGEGTIMVATIAFGMGINKPDIRFVAHLNLPRTLEGYYQETGRAGRDGESADAWMVYSLSDVVMLRQMLENSPGDDDFKAIQYRKMEAMLGYCETARCRRQVLLEYFGEDLPDRCGNCDICLGNVEVVDGTLPAQKALSCAYRTGQMFGVNHLIDVLLGKDTSKVRNFGHDKVSTFGIGNELSASEWRSVFRQLVASGLLKVDMNRKGGLRLSARCGPILKGEQVFDLRRDLSGSKKNAKKKAPASLSNTEAGEGPSSFQFDPVLWERLRSLRLELARNSSLPAYTVFNDRTLKELAARLPGTLEEMLNISGIGQAKLDKYGEVFLKVIRQYLEETSHARKAPLSMKELAPALKQPERGGGVFGMPVNEEKV